MPTRFVCLANSFKEGGRCLAGIELDNRNNPIIANGRPKWIRPVCNTPHGEIPTHLVSHINILDIIEIETIGNPNTDYQSENALFRENSIRTVGTFSRNNLNPLCENMPSIFGNRGKAVPQNAIVNLKYSLMLVRTDNFEVVEKTYEDNPYKKQRLVFTYNGNQYDFPITDPVFLHRYQTNPNSIDNINEVFLSLSLGVGWEDWYYKLVAAIIPA
ncbi:MAG: hypothetical protein KGZ58_10040 [Ignavibacteriales bacterium]|nr:hypothetical protein [Ignavibacteriales bacterium]